MKTKFADGLYKHFSWLIILLSMVGYLAYQTMVFDGDLMTTLTDLQSLIHLLFVIFLNITVVSGANDKGVQDGLLSKEFEKADEVNNRLIKAYNNNTEMFRKYIRKLNKHERLILEEDFLFNVGDKKVEELTKKELRKFKKLKPIYHNIFGFNLPLYYESQKDGNVNYGASFDKRKDKAKAMITKVVTGLLFGAMTVNLIVDIGNIGNAFISLLIISSGLAISYLMNFFKPLFTLKYELPKKVIQKHTLFQSFNEYQKGDIELKEVVEEQEELRIIKEHYITPKVEFVRT